ncbi:ADP,ATP carrier protein 3, mitochondrial-like [Lingula anatina]|uniref:ADP/ATP translocase n=1 Tax=Lingula anatina TaxID=7574 RepID=A0A1S3JQV5_LINAN|nr:ADP,ATP carrier protein 3, mitochondrial [Lingula anatina]XP_013412745.1 ADP,ATP carrier protein 3, mitochondrial-like [Lingula anatina]|eukprot:XP_013382561.1 ADP,ATP carrier protein 3, mitochondrial [Lingula anatina]
MASKPQQQAKKLGFVEVFALSGAAAVISKTAAAPIERIKLVVQNQSEMVKAGTLERPFKGIIDCTTWIYKNEGLIYFWRGNIPNCIRYFPTQALNFAFRDKIKKIFASAPNEPYPVTFSKNIASGGVAGALSLMFVYSLDYCRTRLANDMKSAKKGSERQFTGMFDVYSKTWKADGIKGLYRGFVVSCVGIIVYRGCYFGFYDSLKPVLLGHDAGVATSFLLGYAVTVTSGLISYPIDTIRRRMMMTSGGGVHYSGSIDCAIQIFKHEGAMSFMKGAGANILRGVAGAGVLAGFDKFKAVYVAWRLKSA